MHLYLEDVFLYQLVEVLAGFIPPQGSSATASPPGLVGASTPAAAVEGDQGSSTPAVAVVGDQEVDEEEGILDVVRGGAIVPEEVEILMRELYHPLLVETFKIGAVDIGKKEMIF